MKSTDLLEDWQTRDKKDDFIPKLLKIFITIYALCNLITFSAFTKVKPKKN